MIKKLLPYARGFIGYAVLGMVMIVAEVVLEVFIPRIMSDIIDVGVANLDMHYVLAAGGRMVLMAMLALICGASSARFSAVAATGFARNLRQALFHKLQDYSFANIDRFSTASLITRLTVDVTNTQTAFLMCIRVLIRAPLMLTAATVMVITTNARLSTVFLVAIPVLAVVLFSMARMAYPRFKTMLGKYDDMNASVQEKLTGIRLIKSFVGEDHERADFASDANEVREAQMRAEKVVISNAPVMMLTTYACIVAVLWFGGKQIIAGTMLSGDLISFITYIGQILISLMILSMVFIMLVVSRASIQRICECLEEVPDIRDREFAPGEEAPRPENGAVEFRHVDFSYSSDPDNLNLRDVNLKIDSGMTVGILGGTGSAKTTLVQLIPRLYDVTAGQVLVAGRDVRDYRVADLRDGVAMVLQNNLLFSGTIEENLRWGKADATQEEIEAAARAACAHDFITSFPKGYQTELGQAGVNVSGGQKQRLTIARALLKQPRIIILDDSTSAVDTATDAAIRKAFREQLGDTTAIIIAQRISSVMDADLIVVLDEGQIVATGDHRSLLETCSIYQEVYASQMAPGDREEGGASHV
ncbi:MAG: ABC transporter ATP-binding protein [Firmicutes bacterium]|nr:ABC transporter ATP-binding protein [Bacillota bacterium]